MEPRPLNTKIVYVAHLPEYCPGLHILGPDGELVKEGVFDVEGNKENAESMSMEEF